MRREEESTSTASTILCSLLIVLFSINNVEARNHKEFCSSSSSSCGDIKNISYPFRLKGDPAGCGDPDYELSCVNNKTILEISPGKYFVQNISYYEQTLRLVDVNFANGSCSFPSGSLEVDNGVRDFRFRGFVNGSSSRVRFIKCSRNMSQAQTSEFNYTTIPCLTANGSYVYATYDGDFSYNQYQPSCSIVSVASVDNYHQDVYESPSYEGIIKLLQGGFNLGWSVECRDCSLAGKNCVVSSWNKPIIFKCEKDYSGSTRRQIILLLVGVILGALVGLVLIIVILVVVIRRCRRRPKASEEKNVQKQQSLTPTISNS